MPIKTFDSIDDQKELEVCKRYGRQSLDKKSMVIDGETLIPYICDITGLEFRMRWDTLRYGLKDRHNIKNSKTDRKLIEDTIISLFNRNIPFKDIAEKFEYTIDSIKSLLTRRNIDFSFLYDKHIFTEKECEFIKTNYPLYGKVYCSEKLCINGDKIRNKAYALGYVLDKSLPDGYKSCSGCDRILLFECFYKSKYNKGGLGCRCKECGAKDKADAMEKLVKQDKEIIKKQYIKQIFRTKRNDAKRRGLEFDLDIEWITNNFPEYCPALGLKFTFYEGEKRGCPKNSSPSIDRIDNSKGYLKSNSVIICHRANSMKNNGTIEELIKLAEFYKNLNKKQIEYEI